MKKNNLCEGLASLIKKYLRASRKISSQNLPQVFFEIPPQEAFGDLTTNIALKISKILNKPALELANSIVDYLNKEIRKTDLKEDVASLGVAQGGFINFFLSDTYFRKVLKEILTLGDNFGRQKLGRRQKVLIEFVSANPTGPLSVAHARQAAVGDALSNILEFLGFSLKREYYLNDEGNQIVLLGKSIEVRLKELQGESAEFPEGGYQGEYIREIAREIFKKPEILRQAQDTSPKDTEQSRSVRKRKPEFFSDFGVKYILRIIKKELKDFGIRFDSFYSQKALTKSSEIKDALALFKRKGFIYAQDGAAWFKSTAFGDDKDRVVIKSDGSYTYLAPDIAYHLDKYHRGFNWLINLWGPDHHGYIPRLKAAIQALGKKPDSLSIVIVQLATISRHGKPLPMSTRKGQYITLREVLDEVGSDASRFFFLMRRTTAHLDFDLELAKKQTPENPVYYIQYAHARICSIMRNIPRGISLEAADLNLLKEDEELRLMKTLEQFPGVLEACLRNIDPYFITVYLQKLAEDLHRFYDRHRVLGEEKELTRARLALILAARTVIQNGLRLLGISAPESM